jgi:hypothetical protein
MQSGLENKNLKCPSHDTPRERRVSLSMSACGQGDRAAGVAITVCGLFLANHIPANRYHFLHQQEHSYDHAATVRALGETSVLESGPMGSYHAARGWGLLVAAMLLEAAAYWW